MRVRVGSVGAMAPFGNFLEQHLQLVLFHLFLLAKALAIGASMPWDVGLAHTHRKQSGDNMDLCLVFVLSIFHGLFVLFGGRDYSSSVNLIRQSTRAAVSDLCIRRDTHCAISSR